MRRSRDPNYDPELAKQIKANLRHARHEPTAEQEQLASYGNKSPWQLVKRLRLGIIGSEPYEARRPVARTYLALYGALAALLVTLIGEVQVGAGIIAVCLLIGLPKAWTWAHDRLGSGLWVLAAALIVAGELAWASGGAARDTLSHHGNPGSALALVFVGGLIALIGFFRRWGAAGNIFYTSRQLDKDDPMAAAVVSEAAAREGYGRRGAPTQPATDEQTIQALQDAERRDR